MKSSIEEYYEFVKDDFNIDYEEFKLICNAPFSFIKDLTSKGILRDIRLKYFGVFKVSASKVKYYKKSLLTSLKKGNVTQAYYDSKIKTIEEYESNNT